MFDTPIIIIGKRENLRNPRLRELEHVARVSYVSPVYFKDDTEFELAVDQNVAMITLGRPLLRGEAGCALAHRIATQEAIAELLASRERGGVSSWCLILEDDADGVPTRLRTILKFLELLRKEAPSLINFHTGREPRSRRRQSHPGTQEHLRIKRQHYWRGITSSYALNLEAARVVNRNPQMQASFVADWPPNYYPIQFFYSNIGLKQSSAESVIGERPMLSALKRLQLHVRQLSKLSRLQNYYGTPRLALVKILIYYPIVRDFVGIVSLSKFWVKSGEEPALKNS